jgi:hypothetical protein
MSRRFQFRVRLAKVLLTIPSSTLLLLGGAEMLRDNKIGCLIYWTAGWMVMYASWLFAVPLVAKLWPPRSPQE